ncbi:Hsp20/alpha crystallin family protein [Brugia pahangi]
MAAVPFLTQNSYEMSEALVSMTTINVEISDNLKRIDQWDWPLNKNDGKVKVVNTAEKFEVVLEAVYFQPKDIEVKVIGDQLVVRASENQKKEKSVKLDEKLVEATICPQT